MAVVTSTADTPTVANTFNQLMTTIPSLALAAQGRRRINRRRRCVYVTRRRRRRFAAGPAQTELDVVRVEIAELVGVRIAAADAIDGVSDRAEIEIAVGELDLEILGNVVGNAGVQRVGQVPFARVAADAAPEATIRVE